MSNPVGLFSTAETALTYEYCLMSFNENKNVGIPNNKSIEFITIPIRLAKSFNLSKPKPAKIPIREEAMPQKIIPQINMIENDLKHSNIVLKSNEDNKTIKLRIIINHANIVTPLDLFCSII